MPKTASADSDREGSSPFRPSRGNITESSGLPCGRCHASRSPLDMGSTMTGEPREIREPPDPDRPSDVEGLTALFVRHRERLRRMVRLRLDRRLLGRVDPSETLVANSYPLL